MKYPLILILLVSLFAGCIAVEDKRDSLIDYLPAESALVLKINNLNAFKSELKNNEFLSAWKNSPKIAALIAKLSALEQLDTNESSLLSLYGQKGEPLEFIMVMKVDSLMQVFSDSEDLTVEEITDSRGKHTRYSWEGKDYYSATAGNHFLFSSSREAVVEKSGPKNEDPSIPDALYLSANNAKSASLFVNVGKLDNEMARLVAPMGFESLQGFTDWVALDLNAQQEVFSATGLSVSESGKWNYTDLFRGTRPVLSVTPGIAPVGTESIVSYTFDDYLRFTENRASYLKDIVPLDSAFFKVEELGIFYESGNPAVVLNTLGSDAMTNFLDRQRDPDLYDPGSDIIPLSNPEFLSQHMAPLLQGFEARYYTMIENAFVFSADRDQLSSVVNNFKNKSTFNTTASFQTLKESMAETASYTLMATAEGFKQISGAIQSESLLSDFSTTEMENFVFASQLVAEDNFYHTTLVARKNKGGPNSDVVRPRFEIHLDAPIATAPVFVKNHRTGTREIAVQDETNNLYLISTNGKVLWKKQLEGPIQGSISQVDLFKNGNLQMAFTTDSQFLVLDRNGKEVAPFTFTFRGGNLNPLSVFDYDNNRNYRFVVTRGSEVNMYDRQGKKVGGFTYTDTGSPIIGAPQHFRIGRRDYLVFRLENGQLKILNRVGKIRVPIKQEIDFSSNAVYEYKNNFTLTDQKGALYLIDTNGKISSSELNLPPDHGLYATTNTLVYMGENNLNIKGKEISLDYGLYTRPTIFYIYDIIYISVTDIQSRQTYLFNSSGELLPDFPVSGASRPDMSDIDNDRIPELVVQGGDSSLIVYSLK